jgi:hypothetical protein
MAKFNQKYRSFVFLLGILIAGILCIAGIMLFDNDDIVGIRIVNTPPKTNSTGLEKMISDINVQPFSPQIYSTIRTTIESSYSQGLITNEVSNNLITSLQKNYSQQVFKQCELFLYSQSASNSSDILNLLSQLEIIIGANQIIDEYRDQVGFYDYFSIKLPAIVDGFLRGGVAGYDENVGMRFKANLQQMPGLKEKYRNTTHFIRIRNNYILSLDKLYNDWNAEGTLEEE